MARVCPMAFVARLKVSEKEQELISTEPPGDDEETRSQGL